MLKSIVSLSVFAGFVFSGSAIGATIKFTNTTEASDKHSPFAKPQQMVDIGGRRLNLYCSGSGKTTVVFDAPGGEAGWNWIQVQPAVAKQTRACVYDRAGMGFSDPSPRPPTSGNAVEDLHKLLAAAGIAPPYLLVGASFGTANAQLFAYRYPTEVAGLVLVEAEHEDSLARLNKASQGKFAQIQAMFSAIEKACLAESEKGFVPGSELQRTCFGETDDAPVSDGRGLGAARMVQNMSPAYWRLRQAESEVWASGNPELRAARASFGALPIIALVRGLSPFAQPGKPQSALNKAVEAENLAMQKEIAALSQRGTVRIVPDSGHIIHATHPQAVIKAIADVMTQISPSPKP
ncbi:alpha/beta hydrolase [Undibacterium flavidum]|uniref:Alpha/beta hydrolase n=1 Tax=Undibacterium flavidum TaxID=2762297 RepID=A0ABR6Y7T5_9BURK|nr:alpha/beta hydrolase [Undibacterium flavidum]MBC3872661.1 alpha/beta hydrolase [Undibacterium flavidum]